MSETRNMNLSVSVVESTGTSVLVLIKIKDAKFWFSRELGTKEDAGAVASYLESALNEQVRHVRDVEYLRGYRAGRRHKEKQNTHACTLFVGEWMEKEAGK